MMTKQSAVSFLTLGLLSALGIYLILYATPQGLGLSDDSIAYIAGARSILNGQGYREAWLASNGPVTHFPPGFSSILAFVGLSGLDPLRGARFVNAILFGVNTFLLGLIGWRMTRSQIAGLILALLFIGNASMLRVHVVAMSEPLYIFFSLASFLTFHQYYELQRSGANLRTSYIFLFITALLTSFAYLTRYAGLALLATFLVALFILQTDWRKRLTSIGIFFAGFLPLVLAWSIRNKLLADNATNRTIVYHPLTPENIETAIYNFSEFLVPMETWRRALVKIPNLFFIVLSVLALVILIWLLVHSWKQLSRSSAQPPEILSFANGLYLFGYLASIISSMLFFDASTKFKLRINAPMYLSLLVLLTWFGFWVWQKRSTLWKVFIGGFAVFILALSANETAQTLAQLRKGGQGYASFQWYDSEAMDFIDTLPQGIRIYTNQPGPVYLYTNRPSYVLPDLVDPVTGLPREGYEEGVAVLHNDVLSGQAVLALFKFGEESEDVQSVYLHLAQGLYLAHDSKGDKIYTKP